MRGYIQGSCARGSKLYRVENVGGQATLPVCTTPAIKPGFTGLSVEWHNVNGITFLATGAYNNATGVPLSAFTWYQLIGETLVKQTHPNVTRLIYVHWLSWVTFNGDTYLAVGMTDWSGYQLQWFKLVSGALVSQPKPVNMPGEQVSGLEWIEENGNLYLAVTANVLSNRYFWLYKLVNGLLVQIPEATLYFNTTSRSLKWFRINGIPYLAVSHVGSNLLTAYRFENERFVMVWNVTTYTTGTFCEWYSDEYGVWVAISDYLDATNNQRFRVLYIPNTPKENQYGYDPYFSQAVQLPYPANMPSAYPRKQSFIRVNGVLYLAVCSESPSVTDQNRFVWYTVDQDKLNPQPQIVLPGIKPFACHWHRAVNGSVYLAVFCAQTESTRFIWYKLTGGAVKTLVPVEESKVLINGILRSMD